VTQAPARIAVVTIVSGRLGHLLRQVRELNRGDRLADDHVVVAMHDPDLEPALATTRTHPPPRIVHMPASAPALPLAEARNLGAATALAAGAELLVFLDVDCIPAPALLRRYQQAATDRHLLCGPVAYLPPPRAGGYPDHDLAELAHPHPARPAPPDDRVADGGDHSLFWSLSFAVTATAWRAIGGFCEDYTGYGGEDTDFGQLARAAGISIRWVGGATAYHQHHPVSDPPVEHLDDILRNATIFHRRWGWWPMSGWLTEFQKRRLVRFDPPANRWRRACP
jgi:GT2 family glycosyltransferase